MRRCAFPVALLLAMAASAPAQAQRTQSISRPDGSLIVYHQDRPAGRKRAGALLLFQGSGCEPVEADQRVLGYGRMLAPSRVVVTVEKYGVPAASPAAELVEGCSADYWRGNSLSRRVLDALQVTARLREESWWNGDLVLFGGSEGGAVAAMLAPLVPEVRAVIVYSSGIGVPVGELVRMAVPPPVRDQAVAVFAEARRNPDPNRRWGGASYAWWADAVDQVAARSLLQTRAPVLLIHGSRDQSAPVATARASRDLLAGRPERHFTYREYAGYDHFMTDQAGVDHRPEVFAAAREWLRGPTGR
jgi:pimeloyl-ACP methyl ester carboxylesterase